VHIEAWLIPVLFLLVWIVNSIMRGSEDERGKKGRSSLPRGERQAGERPRRPASDIDRFLDEVNRRRRQALERRPGSPDKEKMTSLTPSGRPRPSVRTPVRSTPAPPAVRVPPARTVERRPSPADVAAAVLEVIPVATAVRPGAAETPPAFAPIASAPVASPVASDTSAGGITSISDLLGSADTLRAAVILHEVLGPPLCRRQRQR
jgi:hypothetical protein